MKNPQLILVTGSNGQVGSELRDLSVDFPQYIFQFPARAELDINETEKTTDLVARIKPAFVLNCAAYTAVDNAETDREAAYHTNAKAVGALAAACAQNNARFIHLSTDYVFNGKSRQPLKEDEQKDPVNYYGESKSVGEELALEANPKSIIIRTSWVYSHHGKNFVKTMKRLMAEKEKLQVVADQTGSPTYAADLAATLMQLVQQTNWQAGIYHYSNEGVITWFEFAKEIAAQLQSPCVVEATTTANFPTPAQRPLYSVMDKTKIQETYGVQLQPWQQSLKRCLQKLS